MKKGAGPPANSHWRSRTDWVEDPWADPADKRRRRIERHRRWIASLSDRDWERLAALAELVVKNYGPALPLRDGEPNARPALGGHHRLSEPYGVDEVNRLTQPVQRAVLEGLGLARLDSLA